mgnify:FL=1
MAKPLVPTDARGARMFRVRLVEAAMPTGSRDPDILLAWLLDSMGLVRRKSDGFSVDDDQGALHRVMGLTFLAEPLRGWDAKSISDVSGLSQTGVHHQLVKLRESGLVSTQTDDRWHVYVLRGGSMSASMELISVQAKVILNQRLGELSDHVSESEERMVVPSEEEEYGFRIEVAEPRALIEDEDSLDALVRELGLNGERAKQGDGLSRKLLEELAGSGNAVSLLALSEKFGESRSRVQRSIERMRVAGIVERVPMLERLAQDIYAGLMRQSHARGEDWLMTRGGLGRLDQSVSKNLIAGVRKKSLDSDKVQEILKPVDIDVQRILLNTLGGRMPYGIRIAGKDGVAVREGVMRKAERTLRRMMTVAQRLDESLDDKEN